MGANGVGKTSFYDAISWAVNGVTGRGAFGPKIINWDCRTAEVSVEWSDGRVLTRSQSPNSIRLGLPAQSRELAQAELHAAMGSWHWFQTVHHAQGAALFLDMSPGDRAAMLSDLLRVSLWDDLAANARAERTFHASEASKIETLIARQDGARSACQTALTRAREDLSTASRALSGAKVQLAARRSKLKAELDEALTAVGRERTELEASISNKRRALEMLEQTLTQLQGELEALQVQKQEQEKQWASAQSLLNEAKAARMSKARELNALEATRHRYMSVAAETPCPHCSQYVTGEHRDAILQDAQLAVDNCKSALQTLEAQERTRHDAWVSVEAALSRIKRQYDETYQKCSQGVNSIARAKDGIAWDERELAKLENSPRVRAAEQALKALDETDPLLVHRRSEASAQENIARNERQIAEFEESIAALTTQVQQHKDQERLNEFWAKHFPQVRLWAMELFINRFNLAAQGWLADLGLPGWRLRLDPASDRQQQKLNIEVEPHGRVDPVSPGECSGGEQQRLKIAAQLALASLVPNPFGFEIWDEPSSYLSGTGLRDLMDALKAHAERDRKVILVVDHAVKDYAFAGVLFLTRTDKGVTAAWRK